MLALQAGIPALCLVHDSRTLELCQMMHLPHITLDQAMQAPLSAEQLRQWFSFDAEAFDRSRLALARRTLRFLANNGLVVEDSPLQRFVAAHGTA